MAKIVTTLRRKFNELIERAEERRKQKYERYLDKSAGYLSIREVLSLAEKVDVWKPTIVSGLGDMPLNYRAELEGLDLDLESSSSALSGRLRISYEGLTVGFIEGYEVGNITIPLRQQYWTKKQEEYKKQRQMQEVAGKRVEQKIKSLRDKLKEETNKDE